MIVWSCPSVQSQAATRLRRPTSASKFINQTEHTLHCPRSLRVECWTTTSRNKEEELTMRDIIGLVCCAIYLCVVWTIFPEFHGDSLLPELQALDYELSADGQTGLLIEYIPLVVGCVFFFICGIAFSAQMKKVPAKDAERSEDSQASNIIRTMIVMGAVSLFISYSVLSQGLALTYSLQNALL